MDKKLEWHDVFKPGKQYDNEHAEFRRCQQALDALL